MNANIVPIEQQPKPALEAGSKPSAIVPTNFESAYRLANAVCAAGMAPKGLEKPEQALVAILHGLEIGLTPMAALQRIAVVNGRPTIWGDGAIGLVRGSGACEWIRERIDGDGDAMKAICEAKRRGEQEPIIGEFAVSDAKKAGLWGKSGPWQQYPKRMLQMRARAFCLRDGFADVLGGLYLREEIEDNSHPPRVAPSPSTAPTFEHVEAPQVTQIEHQAPSELPAIEESPKKPATSKRLAPSAAADVSLRVHFDAESVKKRFAKALAAAKDDADINSAWEEIIAPVENEFLPRELDDLQRILRWRLAEIDEAP